MGVLFVFSFSAALLFLGMHRGHCARIVGEQESVPHSRPYMAAIMRGDYLFCGGTLIQENWVLSAAHCDIQTGDKVILGAHSLTKPENEKQEFRVARVIHHPRYNSMTFEHDIVLLQLDRTARITNSVKTVRLPTTNEDVRAGTWCLAAGWGITSTELQPDVLQEINIIIFDRSICQRYYLNSVLTTDHLCAGLTKGRGGTCYGDSGGPLVCGEIQRGITSFGDCYFPVVYTHLTLDHILWINKNIGRW